MGSRLVDSARSGDQSRRSHRRQRHRPGRRHRPPGPGQPARRRRCRASPRVAKRAISKQAAHTASGRLHGPGATSPRSASSSSRTAHP